MDITGPRDQLLREGLLGGDTGLDIGVSDGEHVLRVVKDLEPTKLAEALEVLIPALVDLTGEHFLAVDLSIYRPSVPSRVLGSLVTLCEDYFQRYGGMMSVFCANPAFHVIRVRFEHICLGEPPVYRMEDEAVSFLAGSRRQVLRLEGHVGIGRLEREVLRKYDPRKPLVEVDMSDANFIEPFPCLVLLSFLHAMLRDTTHRVEMRMPKAIDAARFLRDAGFVDHLDASRVSLLEAPPAEPVPERAAYAPDTYGIRRVNAGASFSRRRVTELEGEIARRFHALDLIRLTNEQSLGFVSFIAGELCVNISEHAQSDGFFLVQRNRTRGLLEIAVSDYGVGLLTSLREKHGRRDVSTDSEAIDAALRVKATKFTGGREGVGLGTIKEVLYYSRAEMRMWTGGHMLHIYDREDRRDVAPLQGVHCQIVFYQAEEGKG